MSIHARIHFDEVGEAFGDGFEVLLVLLKDGGVVGVGGEVVGCYVGVLNGVGKIK